MLHFVALTVLAAVPSSSAPPTSAAVKPKWALEYAPNACILSRARSGAAGGIQIETRPYETEHELKLLLPKTGKGSFFKPGVLSVAETPSRSPRYFTVDESAKDQDRLLSGTISEAQLQALAKDAALGVTIAGKLEERVSVTGLGKALVALERCEDDLARRWGTPRQWTTDAQPLSGPAGIIRYEDYPQSLVELDIQGSARLLVKIDTDGQIESCRALETEGPVMFAEVVCSAYKKRMQFTPAKDASGVAVPSYYVIPKVRFILAG